MTLNLHNKSTLFSTLVPSPFLVLFLALSLFAMLSSSAIAQGIRIIDCTGRTRAQHITEAPIAYAVSISVVDAKGNAAEGKEVKLISAGGTAEAIVSADGVAEFPELDSGVWLMGTDTRGLYYHEIALKDNRGGFWLTGSEVLTIAAVVGAAAATAIVLSLATRGHPGSDGGSNTPGTGGNDCQSCNPDADAPSIPGFE